MTRMLGWIGLFLITSFARANVTTASGMDELMAARQAAGGDHWNAIGILKMNAGAQINGCKASTTRLEDVADGRLLERQDLCIETSGQGDDGHEHWVQDSSGGIHALNSTFSDKVNVTQRWLTRRGWLLPNAAGADIGTAHAKIANGKHFWVVRATPVGGEPVFLWFDVDTHLLFGLSYATSFSTHIETYTDYRDIDGVQLPFRITTRDTCAPGTNTLQVEKWATHVPISTTIFSRPTPPDDTQLSGSTTVPIEIDGGMLIVPVTIHDQHFEFILDTGAHNIMTPAVAKALGLNASGSGAIEGGDGAGHLDSQYTRVDKLEIGAATLDSQPFSVVPLPYAMIGRGERAPLSGLIGMELFERFATRVDYDAKTLTLTRLSDYHHQGPGTAVPLTFTDDDPIIDVEVNGMPAVAELDTGNSGWTTIYQPYARRTGLRDVLKGGVASGARGVGGISTEWVSRIKTLKIGTTLLKRPIVSYNEDNGGAFSSAAEDINLGTDALAHFIIETDYKDGVVWLQSQAHHIDAIYNRSGLGLERVRPEALEVMVVVAGSPAAKAGLNLGDQIISIDATPVDQLTMTDIRSKWTGVVGSQVQLTVISGHMTRNVNLHLAEVLPENPVSATRGH